MIWLSVYDIRIEEAFNINYVSVIVTYNRKLLLTEAVESLLQQTNKPQQIVILDNHSSDGTETYLRSHFDFVDQSIEYHRLPENIGGSGGFAAAIKDALKYECDWISLSDDDAIFERHYFQQLSNYAERNRDIAALSGTVRFENMDIDFTHRRRVRDWNTLAPVPVATSEYVDNFNYDVSSFVGLVVKKSMIQKIGLPESDFFIWVDDFEYSLRIRQHSEIINVSDATIVHKTGISSVAFRAAYQPDWREYYGLRNRVVMVQKHGKNKVLSTLFLLAWMFGKIATVPMKRFAGYRRHVLRVYVDAFRDAFRHKLGKNNRYLPK
ncbi:glycosyltransferase family 2 protein [Furfurilactobacillus rossiae]|uniref:Glycosyltransferase n=1 Tax=Furfurilactobacillus rossiae DSM 15814 TaxID=1114972 RepID=A0A0R1RHY7_9LACO|nr:glycosyltransferase family 2 protein [Furfurilactobacillus rossiae]KRL56463.1 glycosyltransferase [Furfurilactobacillus rossiae DSM 15814]QFR67966.1 glycosyltransferase [Furfurilactobacillus rossiae]QLE60955.1 glycosyltransferase [Furfurilactobacillus rossiae]